MYSSQVVVTEFGVWPLCAQSQTIYQALIFRQVARNDKKNVHLAANAPQWAIS